MAYGEKQITFAVCDGVNTIEQQMEYNGRYLTVEVRISGKYGFVDVKITDNETGEDLDLDIQLTSLNNTEPLEATLTAADEEIGTLHTEQFNL